MPRRKRVQDDSPASSYRLASLPSNPGMGNEPYLGATTDAPAGSDFYAENTIPPGYFINAAGNLQSVDSIPRNSTLSATPSGQGDGSSDGIEPDLLPQAAPGPLSDLEYFPSEDAHETPLSNPVLGNKDWIKEHWNQWNPSDVTQGVLDNWMPGESDQVSLNDPNAPTITGNASTPFNPVQAWNPNAPQYSHPDDAAFPMMGPQYSNLPSGSFSPQYSQYMQNFGQNQSIGSDYNASLDSMNYGRGYGDTVPPVSDSAGAIQNFAGDQTRPTGLQLGDQPVNPDFSLGEDLNASAADLGFGTRPPPETETQNPPPPQGVGGSGQGPVPTPAPYQNSTLAFGYGSNTGQPYYSTNGGQTWAPTSQAPQNVRWDQYSGTGNYNASMYTNSYQLSGQQPGAPNNARGVSDAGRTSFNPNFGTGFVNDQGFIERRTAQPQWGNPQAGEGG